METNDPSKVTTEGVQHQQAAEPQAPMAATSIPSGFSQATTAPQAGALPWLDPTTAAILLNPNTAATAFAAIAASAAQTVAQQQQQQQVQVHAQQHAAVAQAHAAQSAILAAQQHHHQQHQTPVTVQQQVLTAPAPGVPVLAPAAVAPAPQAPVAAQAVAPQPAPVPVSQVVQHQPVLPAATASAPPPAQHQIVTAAPTPQAAPVAAPQQQQQLVSVLPATSGTATPTTTTTVPFLNATGLPTTTYAAAPAPSAPASAAPANSVLQVAAMMQAAAVAQQQQQAQSLAAATNANVFAAMQNWKLEQLEAHVQLLRETGRPVPPNVEMLLQEARRKEDKKTAKRVANRKSACTSRARKKALVEEMTRTNARLRRQALILALLPDLVIAITVDGTITFGSQQVERVLRHKTSDLIGANLTDLLVPECRQALRHLIDELVAAERAAVSGVVGVGDSPMSSQPAASGGGSRSDKNTVNGNGRAAAPGSSATSSAGNGAAVVSSEASVFPLAVVKVENQGSGAEENSDLSTSNGGKGSHSSMKGSAASSFNEGENGKNGNGDDKKATKSGKKKKSSAESSDDSFSSSLGKANENLSRNVRWHNEQMQSKKEGGKEKTKHRDDVTGASVTANNADARLSSLQHVPEKLSPRAVKSKQESLEDNSSSSSDSLLAGVEEKKKRARKRKARHDNSSDESGYRESNESGREETSSEDNDSSNDSGNGRRPKPLAPTCTVCLIRDDLSTIWCEVTSSIRTRSLKEENQEAIAAAERRGPKAGAAAKAPSSASTESTNDEIKELLLCLRPIRDGETTVDESLRFQPVAKRAINSGIAGTTAETSTPPLEPNSEQLALPSTAEIPSTGMKGPPKKRPIQPEASMDLTKISVEESDIKRSGNPSKRLKKDHTNESEKSVVESLMLMSNNLASPKNA